MTDSASSARVRGMISRAVTGKANDATTMQSLQLELFSGQVADDVEHFQPYGLSSVPHAGAEGIALAIGGSTGHTVVINVDDRRFRITGLQDGEVVLYDDMGHKVYLTRNGIVIDGAGQLVTITNTPKVRVEADIEATGQIKDLCDSAGGRTMAQMRATYTGHNHTVAGVASGMPNQPV